ncbi:MAG: Gfo/Idh/MocA family oxidoreductase, partial [Acidobacteriales bacterium]|nr:Gfo/Idh/MocA family oxidoreductase [Terriglobales bacterium]
MKDKARRKFLKQSIGLGAAGAALLARPISAAAYSRVLGANDRIRVALIGCGGMGRSDLRDFLKVKDVECVALCDVDDSQVAEGMKKIVEPTSQTPGLTTRDFRKVLDMKELEAVIVATPDHWHALPMVMACQAGKDVYVEKPLSVSIGEGRVMVDVARKHDRVVQMGTQQRSAPHYADAVDYVKSGKLGRVRLVRAWAYLDWKG